MPKSEVIRASGVVLLRTSDASGSEQVLVVHRPGRADWSLPKGKVDAGEHVIGAAVRECDEETGFTPTLQLPLPTQAYSVGGRPKVVSYWRARIRSEEGFAPDDEVDAIDWIDLSEVRSRLTYPGDADLVDHAAALPDTIPLVILRHTQALKRSDFAGEADIDRPLTGRGRTQAKALVPLLDAFGELQLHSSSARRCADTVKKYAKSLGTTTVLEPSITEEDHHITPKAAARRTAELSVHAEPLVICSHRPVLPTIFASAARALGVAEPESDPAWDPKLPPGGFVVIHRKVTAKGRLRVAGIERHALPDL